MLLLLKNYVPINNSNDGLKDTHENYEDKHNCLTS